MYFFKTVKIYLLTSLDFSKIVGTAERGVRLYTRFR